MKTNIARWFAALIFSLAPISATAQFNVDTSGTAMSGLWDNANESGWGTAVIHQYGIMFVTMYTYDGSGNPVWYVASNCGVIVNSCSGTLYRVTGGSGPTVPWNGANRAVTSVGLLTMAFDDLNTATMFFTINGVSGVKAVRRSVFATAPSGPTNPVADTCNASHFTLAKFNAISRGMTLERVSQTIGCRNNTSLTQRDAFKVTYVWATLTGSQMILVLFDPTGTLVCSESECPAFFKLSSGF